jgi:hypothetical protein
MNLLEKLIETLPKDPIPVRKIIIGVHWALVSSKHCGLGSTLVSESPHGHSQIRKGNLLCFKGADMLDGTPLLDIKPYVPDFDIFSVTKIGWYANRAYP